MNPTFLNLSTDDLRIVIREEVERAFGKPAIGLIDKPKYLSRSNASKKYGVSDSFLYRLSSDREVSTRRVGKNIEFDVNELEEFFNKKTKRSRTAIDADLRKNGVFPTLKGNRHA